MDNRSDEIEEMLMFTAEKEAKKLLADDAIIEMKKQNEHAEATNKNRFILSIVISVLTLLVAISSMIITVLK